MAVERTDAIIAGVNKAGTTSLFVSLSTHPHLAPSAIKEARYFLPARYGQPLEPFSVYEDYFRDAPGPVHLEATPNYFYGGAAVAAAMRGKRPRRATIRCATATPPRYFRRRPSSHPPWS